VHGVLGGDGAWPRIGERMLESAQSVRAVDIDVDVFVETLVANGDLHSIGRLAPDERYLQPVAFSCRESCQSCELSGLVCVEAENDISFLQSGNVTGARPR
jgi:hypothetical protein